MEKDGKDIIQSMKYIERGVKPTNKALFPISSHYAEVLFDNKKLKEFFIENGRTIFETYAYSKQISGETFQEAVQNYGGSFSVGGSGNYCAASFSGSVSSEFNMQSTETNQMKFSQIRKMAQYAKLILPKSLQRESLRKLLCQDALDTIDSVTNLNEAKDVIDCFGPFYLESIILGALLTISSKEIATETNSSQNLSASLSAEVSYMTASVNTNSSFSMGVNTGKKLTNLTYTIAALGGNPSLILTGDENAWIKSACTDLACIDANFGPLYNLAKKNSDSEKFIKEAFEIEMKKKEKELQDFSSKLTVKKQEVKKADVYTVYTRHEEDWTGSTTKGHVKILKNNDVFCDKTLSRGDYFSWVSTAKTLTGKSNLGDSKTTHGITISEEHAIKLKNLAN